MENKKNLLFLSPSVLSKKERECVLEDFESLSTRALGEGAFGQVFKVRHKSTGSLYAIKMISKSKIIQKNMLEQLKRELRIMYSLNHKYIIKLYNHFEDSKNFYLIMELAEGGSLFARLVKVRSFDERTTAQYMKEVALAVQYLHTREPAIIHRDIKPENIFLDRDGCVKLGDFGWSSLNDNVRSTYCGTLDYLAPEMIHRTGHDTRLDLWNLGVLLFELLTGRAPFESKTQEELFDKIQKVKVGFPKNFPSSAKDLVKSLLKTNPQDRISIASLLEHPWMTQHPPLRLTCELQTKTEKIIETSEIPENDYKIISQAETSSKQLMQEKSLTSLLRKKLQTLTSSLSSFENYLERLKTRVLIAETSKNSLKDSIFQLNQQLLNDKDLESFSYIQEDIDDRIVKVKHKIRKLDFEIKLKKKEAAAKRQSFYEKIVKNAVNENKLLGLKSFFKEFKWIINTSKNSFYAREFAGIVQLILEGKPDQLVRGYLEDLRLDYDCKSELASTIEDLQDLITEKEIKIEEAQGLALEISQVVKIKSQVLSTVLPKFYF
jgi:serine/threonine protein kinase